MRTSVQLEPIRINPVEELLKAYSIVHGRQAGEAMSHVVWRVLEHLEKRAIEACRNVGGDGI